MHMSSRIQRFLLGMVVVAVAFAERPRAMRWDIFMLWVFAGLVITNLAFSWGQRLRAKDRAPDGAFPSILEAKPGASTAQRKSKHWGIPFCLFAGCTMVGIAKAHETGIWLFAPGGILAGAACAYFVLKSSA